MNFKRGITSICRFIVTVNGNFKFFFFEDPRPFRRSNHVSFTPSKEFYLFIFYYFFFSLIIKQVHLFSVSLHVIYTSPQFGSQIYIGINLVF